MADELPPISNPDAFTVPARPATVFANNYIIDLHLETVGKNILNQPITVKFRPYNYDSKVIYDEDVHQEGNRDRVEQWESVWLLAQQYPVAKLVMGGLVKVFSDLFDLRLLAPKIKTVTDSIAYANARLANLDARIGNGDDETTMEELLADKAAVEASLTPLTEQQTTLTGQRAAILAGLGVS